MGKINVKKIFRYELKVSIETIDENGHVNSVEYLRWMPQLYMRTYWDVPKRRRLSVRHGWCARTALNICDRHLPVKKLSF